MGRDRVHSSLNLVWPNAPIYVHALNQSSQAWLELDVDGKVIAYQCVCTSLMEHGTLLKAEGG